MIKTRFAPSPTGFLHVGGLRTALYAYLLAKRNDGKFVLRIEDTDQTRFVEGSLENILDSFDWSHITIDEGVLREGKDIAQKGDCGPYIQSERLDIYKRYIDDLIQAGHAYYCFCTKERLDDMREYQQQNKLPTGYDGHCRNLNKEEVDAKLHAGEDYVIRMKMPKEGITVIEDMVRGRVEFQNKLIDDQVLIKADGFPTYHFAVVVDDHLMEITHVIRGEEWLPSTPKHVALYEMFGWKKPEFAHLPVLVNENKQKLSKRHGDVSVQDFRDKGYLPEALVNFIAFLGWNPGTDKEIFSLAELEKEFTFEKVGKSAAFFNREKLDWYNKHYIMDMEPADLALACVNFYKNSGIDTEGFDLPRIVAMEQGRANTLLDIVENTGFMFADNLNYEPELLVWKKSDRETTKVILQKLHGFLNSVEEGEWSKEHLEEKLFAWIADMGFGNGDVLWPLRVSLSGQKNSPGPFEIAPVLGQEATLERIEKAINLL